MLTPTIKAPKFRIAQDAIDAKHNALGGDTGLLSNPTEDLKACPDSVGFFRRYKNGMIYWTPSTEAHEIHGAILAKWSALGFERSFLGYPLTDESQTPDAVGRYNHFQGGSIYWTPITGAYEVHGAIRGKWASMGWERSFLGYPVSDEHDSDDGRISDFQYGSIFWTAGSGPLVRGAFVTITYDQLGACNGYPHDEDPDGPGPYGPHRIVTAGANAAYVTFKVLSLDNSHNADFKFDPARCFINQTPRAYIDTTLSFTRDLGVFAAIPRTVPGGTIEGNNGIMVAVVGIVAGNPASQANNTSYFLTYDPAPGDPAVLLVRRNADQTSFPQTDSCLAIRY